MERPHIWGVFVSSPHQSSCCDCRRLQAGDEYLNGNPVLADTVELWAFFPKIALFLCSLHRWLHSCVNGHPPSTWVSRSSVAPKPENHWHLLRQRKKPPLPLWWFSWHQTSDAIWLIILPDHSESEPPFPLHFHLQWLFSSWQKLWQQGLSAISSHWPTWFSKLYFTFYDPVKSIWIFRYLPTLISLVSWICCWSRLCLSLSWQRLIPSMTTGESLSER